MGGLDGFYQTGAGAFIRRTVGPVAGSAGPVSGAGTRSRRTLAEAVALTVVMAETLPAFHP